MGVISLDAVNPGMVLAGDVKDRNGRILLSAGSEITEKHLRIFKMWGILSVQIQGSEKEDLSPKATVEIDPIRLQRVEQSVKELFRHNDLNHPFIKELFRLVSLEHLSHPEEISLGS